jgi:hypothetical protein
MKIICMVYTDSKGLNITCQNIQPKLDEIIYNICNMKDDLTSVGDLQFVTEITEIQQMHSKGSFSQFEQIKLIKSKPVS